MSNRLLIAGLLVTCSAAPLRAQDQALPFHRGQWGTMINIGGLGVAAGAGFLHFRNHDHAWVLDAGGTAQHATVHSDTGGVPVQAFTQNANSVTVRVGSRSYHSLGDHADRQVTFGVSGQYNHASNTSQGNPRQTGFGAGVFAELGAEWLVASHFGLGASWGAALNYNWTRAADTFASTRVNNLTLSVGTVQLHGAFYF